MKRTAHTGWHQEDIKAAIRKTGITLKQLALSNDLSESACRMAILYNFVPSGEVAIAKHLKISPHELWPQRYHPNGTRSIGRNSTSTKAPRHRQKTKVA